MTGEIHVQITFVYAESLFQFNQSLSCKDDWTAKQTHRHVSEKREDWDWLHPTMHVIMQWCQSNLVLLKVQHSTLESSFGIEFA